jgi:putative peptidoglycan lipid II flippase
MLSRIFSFQTKNITTAALILAGFSFLSRLLGLWRDRLLAGRFGAGSDLDVYFAAFRIPDFIYNILIAGGIIVALVPLFSEYFLKDKKRAWDFIDNLLNVSSFLLVLVSIVGVIFTPALLRIITPGFSPEQFSLAVLLTRILFLSPIFLGLSSIFSGILQYFNRFLAYSLAPLFYNLGIIFGIIFLAPSYGILGVVLGVVLGAFLHLLVQIPSAIQAGFFYKPILNFKEIELKRVFSLMAPRTLGVAAPQINLMVATAIASSLPSGALSVFSFANNLSQFPLGLVGIPFAVAAFPALSQSFALKNKKDFLKNFSNAFYKILYVVIPLSFLIFFLRNQIIEIVLKTGRFGESATNISAAALGLFSLGIFAACFLPLIFRAFFSLHDTKTPTIVAIAAMVLNFILMLIFVNLLSSPNFFQTFVAKIFSIQGGGNIGVLGLPLAFSIDSILQFVILMVLLKKRINFKFSHEQHS